MSAFAYTFRPDLRGSSFDPPEEPQETPPPLPPNTMLTAVQAVTKECTIRASQEELGWTIGSKHASFGPLHQRLADSLEGRYKLAVVNSVRETPWSELDPMGFLAVQHSSQNKLCVDGGVSPGHLSGAAGSLLEAFARVDENGDSAVHAALRVGSTATGPGCKGLVHLERFLMETFATLPAVLEFARRSTYPGALVRDDQGRQCARPPYPPDDSKGGFGSLPTREDFPGLGKGGQEESGEGGGLTVDALACDMEVLSMTLLEGVGDLLAQPRVPERFFATPPLAIRFEKWSGDWLGWRESVLKGGLSFSGGFRKVKSAALDLVVGETQEMEHHFISPQALKDMVEQDVFWGRALVHNHGAAKNACEAIGGVIRAAWEFDRWEMIQLYRMSAGDGFYVGEGVRARLHEEWHLTCMPLTEGTAEGVAMKMVHMWLMLGWEVATPFTAHNMCIPVTAINDVVKAFYDSPVLPDIANVFGHAGPIKKGAMELVKDLRFMRVALETYPHASLFVRGDTDPAHELADQAWRKGRLNVYGVLLTSSKSSVSDHLSKFHSVIDRRGWAPSLKPTGDALVAYDNHDSNLAMALLSGRLWGDIPGFTDVVPGASEWYRTTLTDGFRLLASNADKGEEGVVLAKAGRIVAIKAIQWYRHCQAGNGIPLPLVYMVLAEGVRTTQGESVHGVLSAALSKAIASSSG